MYHESDPGQAGYPTLNVYMAKFDPGWEGYPVWQTGLPALAGHLTFHVNVIKLKWEIIIMDRRVTPPKRFTSPSWEPPPPRKQAFNPLYPPRSIPAVLVWFLPRFSPLKYSPFLAWIVA